MTETDANVPRPAPDTVPCPICGEQIRPVARKCIHCQSYLDWRRYVALGSSAVPVMAALVAILAAVASWIGPMVQTRNSRLNVAFGGVGGSQLNGEATLTVFNDGSRVGVFDAAMLRVNWNVGGHELSFDVALGNGETVPISAYGSMTIQAGIGLKARLNRPTTSAEAVALFAAVSPNDYSTAPIAHATCLIRADTTDANGHAARPQIMPVNCLPFAPWLAYSVQHPIE
jgi:hypothetical protein